MTAASTRRPRPSLRAVVKEVIIVVVGALIISLLIRNFVGELFLVPSKSMENTLMIGDRIVALKITKIQRGDVVAFADPDDWLHTAPPERGPVGQVMEVLGLLPDTSRSYLVKRVIGMPGDRVTCCDNAGRVTVNGHPLDEKSYLDTTDGSPDKPSRVRFDVVVPQRRIWVMGDHRDNSADSRCHLAETSPDGRSMNAFVPIADVVGPAVAIVAPFGRVTKLNRPTTFDSIPDPTRPAPATPVVNTPAVKC